MNVGANITPAIAQGIADDAAALMESLLTGISIAPINTVSGGVETWPETLPGAPPLATYETVAAGYGALFPSDGLRRTATVRIDAWAGTAAGAAALGETVRTTLAATPTISRVGGGGRWLRTDFHETECDTPTCPPALPLCELMGMRKMCPFVLDLVDLPSPRYVQFFEVVMDKVLI